MGQVTQIELVEPCCFLYDHMSEGRHSYQHPFTSYFRDSHRVPRPRVWTTQMGKWKDALWDDTRNFTDGVVALVLEPGEDHTLGINIRRRGQRLPSVAAQVGFVARQRGTEGGYPEGGCGQFVEQHHRRDLIDMLDKIVYICWV